MNIAPVSRIWCWRASWREWGTTHMGACLAKAVWRGTINKEMTRTRSIVTCFCCTKESPTTAHRLS